MNCFVIMPFSAEFDDVYEVMKSAVEGASGQRSGRCFRLDESRPAGRITDRLLAELRSASLCIADLTGTKPNVMWEVGFAMALAKPTIIVTQDLATLPFDPKDMQSISYDRNRLSASLAVPLRRSILDTLGTLPSPSHVEASATLVDTEAFGAVLAEVAALKSMLSEAVRAWKSDSPQVAASQPDVAQLVGNWVNKQSGSHLYSRVIHGSLVTPYCFGGTDELTGIYYDWRRVGEYWFARYKWLADDPAGFTFLRQESVDTLVGAWWDSDSGDGSEIPQKHAGIPSTWVRQEESPPPRWAQRLLDAVERRGLATVLKGATAELSRKNRGDA